MSTIQIAPAMSDVRVRGSKVTATYHNGRRYVYELPQGMTFPRSTADRYEVRRNFRDALLICSYVDQVERLMNDWLHVEGVLVVL